MFFGNALWQLVVMSDTFSKLILLSLLCMSIICWAIFLYKYIVLRVKKNHLHEAAQAVRHAATLEDLVTISRTLAKTVPGYLLTRTLSYTKKMIDQHKAPQGTVPEPAWNAISMQIEHTFDEIMQQEEMYMPILFACAGVATLFGLLGTVWGLINSFVRIGEKHSADIAAIAPGIAEALIITLAGLVVAIPAYLMYQYLAVQLRKTELQMTHFCESISLVLKSSVTKAKEIQ